MSQSKSAGGRDRYARWHVDEAVEQDSENWLLSYLDLITLLLAMLVVMLAISRLHGFPARANRSSWSARWPPAACPPTTANIPSSTRSPFRPNGPRPRPRPRRPRRPRQATARSSPRPPRR